MLNTIFLQDAPTVIPLWIALIGLIGSLIAPIVTAYVGYRLGKPKQTVEIEGEQRKNQKQSLENYQFSNEVFEKTTQLIIEKNKRITELTEENHQANNTIRLKNFEIARHQGMQELAFQERDKVIARIDQLEESLQKEKEECESKINAFKEKVKKVFEENNIKFDDFGLE